MPISRDLRLGIRLSLSLLTCATLIACAVLLFLRQPQAPGRTAVLVQYPAVRRSRSAISAAVTLAGVILAAGMFALPRRWRLDALGMKFLGPPFSKTWLALTRKTLPFRFLGLARLRNRTMPGAVVL